jgi:hypothetical protein
MEETFVWIIVWAIIEPFVETIVGLPSKVILVMRVSRALELRIGL